MNCQNTENRMYRSATIKIQLECTRLAPNRFISPITIFFSSVIFIVQLQNIAGQAKHLDVIQSALTACRRSPTRKPSSGTNIQLKMQT
jgi:hypothetical protein